MRFHDVRVLTGGDYWILCDEIRVMDLSLFGGDPAAEVKGTVVQHVSSAGSLLFEWKALDHFGLADVDSLNFRGQAGPFNLMHGNALELDTDGNILISFRQLNLLAKIDVSTGEPMWIFGGKRNQFTFANDSKGSFQKQHGLRVSGPDEIVFLDNSDTAPSRFMRMKLDLVANTATTLMEFVDDPATHTPVGGNTEPYSNGHGIVSFGRAGRVVEVNELGARAWELTGIDGVFVFRAHRIPSLYRR